MKGWLKVDIWQMANSMPLERLQALDNVEKEIASCIQSAGKIQF